MIQYQISVTLTINHLMSQSCSLSSDSLPCESHCVLLEQIDNEIIHSWKGEEIFLWFNGETIPILNRSFTASRNDGNIPVHFTLNMSEDLYKTHFDVSPESCWYFFREGCLDNMVFCLLINNSNPFISSTQATVGLHLYSKDQTHGF